MLCGYTRKMLNYTDLTSAQRSNIPSGQTSCRPMHRFKRWILVGKPLEIRHCNVGPTSSQHRPDEQNDDGPTLAFNVKPTSGTTFNRRWTNVGNKTLKRRANVEPISRANVDPMSKMTTGQRWHSTSNQRQRRPLTDVGPPSLCRLGC